MLWYRGVLVLLIPDHENLFELVDLLLFLSLWLVALIVSATLFGWMWSPVAASYLVNGLWAAGWSWSWSWLVALVNLVPISCLLSSLLDPYQVLGRYDMCASVFLQPTIQSRASKRVV